MLEVEAGAQAVAEIFTAADDDAGSWSSSR